jgi:NTP pyrophosphatase (non-canonical NTP hydrolase)
VRQRQVHDMIQSVGGYWRPVNGVVRLLEELGELGELIQGSPGDIVTDELAEEFADVWIITTCTANQFNVDLKARSASGAAVANGISALLPYAGTIARIINYYDGPKNPRSVADWPTLGAAIESFQAELISLASHLRVDIDSAIDAKLRSTPIRDSGRFATSYDPSTAGVLQGFEQVRVSSPCSFAERAKLWGAPDWRSDRTIGWNAERVSPYLAIFCKAAEREGLDGFVIGPGTDAEAAGMSGLAKWFAAFLSSLAENDPLSADKGGFAGVDMPGWQFSFRGVRMFVSVFSSLYANSHPRHSPSGTYFFLQPEASFEAYRIGSRYPFSGIVKESIRSKFSRLGYSYPAELIDERVESRIYLLPRWPGDADVQWWRKIAAT